MLLLCMYRYLRNASYLSAHHNCIVTSHMRLAEKPAKSKKRSTTVRETINITAAPSPVPVPAPRYVNLANLLVQYQNTSSWRYKLEQLWIKLDNFDSCTDLRRIIWCKTACLTVLRCASFIEDRHLHTDKHTFLHQRIRLWTFKPNLWANK